MRGPRHTRQTDPRRSWREVMSQSRARRARRLTVGVTALLVAVLVLTACRLAATLVCDRLGSGAFTSATTAERAGLLRANTPTPRRISVPPSSWHRKGRGAGWV